MGDSTKELSSRRDGAGGPRLWLVYFGQNQTKKNI